MNELFETRNGLMKVEGLGLGEQVMGAAMFLRRASSEAWHVHLHSIYENGAICLAVPAGGKSWAFQSPIIIINVAREKKRHSWSNRHSSQAWVSKCLEVCAAIHMRTIPIAIRVSVGINQVPFLTSPRTPRHTVRED